MPVSIISIGYTTNGSLLFLYCIFLSLEDVRCFLPSSPCISHRQEVSFAAAAGCLVSHDQCESQDPVPSVILSEPESPLCFLSRRLLCRSCKCCLCHLSRRCQVSRISNKTSKWSAFLNIMHVSELISLWCCSINKESIHFCFVFRFFFFFLSFGLFHYDLTGVDHFSNELAEEPTTRLDGISQSRR